MILGILNAGNNYKALNIIQTMIAPDFEFTNILA